MSTESARVILRESKNKGTTACIVSLTLYMHKQRSLNDTNKTKHDPKAKRPCPGQTHLCRWLTRTWWRPYRRIRAYPICRGICLSIGWNLWAHTRNTLCESLPVIERILSIIKVYHIHTLVGAWVGEVVGFAAKTEMSQSMLVIWSSFVDTCIKTTYLWLAKQEAWASW